MAAPALERPRILAVDEDPALAAALGEALASAPPVIRLVDPGEVRGALEEGPAFHLAVLGLPPSPLPDPGVLTRLREAAPHLPVLGVAPAGDASAAEEGLRGGARDVIFRPLRLEELGLRLRRLLGVGGGAPAAELGTAAPGPPMEALVAAGWSLAELERRFVLGVLDAHDGKRGTTAAALGVDPKTLYRKLKRWAARGPACPPAPDGEGPGAD